jgi:hypothetical protein
MLMNPLPVAVISSPGRVAERKESLNAGKRIRDSVGRGKDDLRLFCIFSAFSAALWETILLNSLRDSES